MKQGPGKNEEENGECQTCGAPMVKHNVRQYEKVHYFGYCGNGLSCAVKNCEQNHGKEKCDK